MRAALREYPSAVVETHGAINDYLVSKGYYHPEDISEQSQVNARATNAAITLSQQWSMKTPILSEQRRISM
ncbi:hypothetical protein [Peribacillus sp. NPDC097895]|uniref:hypothetical protein n=1 Tax=Peribacillus sp. NPDC097895 TaxID=3390619 RepID=UPI003D016F3D